MNLKPNNRTQGALQPDFATVLTSKGQTKISSLRVDNLIWSKNGWIKVTAISSVGKKPVYSYVTSNNCKFIGVSHSLVETSKGVEIVGDASDVFSLTELKFSDIFRCDYIGEHEVFELILESANQHPTTYFSGGVSVYGFDSIPKEQGNRKSIN